MKRIILTILTAFMLSSSILVYAEEEKSTREPQISKTMSFTIDEAVEYALGHNRDIKIQDIYIEKAELDSSKILYDMKKYADYEVITRRLKDSGATERGATLQRGIADWNKEITRNEIKYNTRKKYYELFKSTEMVKVAKEGLDLSKNVYDQSVLKHKLGVISSQQLLFTETELKQAESNLDNAKLDYEGQRMSFNDELGLPLTTKIGLESKITYNKNDEIDVEKAVKEGLENNAVLKVLRENHEISKLSLDAISAKFSSNTFNYKEQDIKVEETLKNLENTKNKIELQVRNSSLVAETKERQIDTYDKLVEKAENIYRLSLLSFDVGENTVNDIASSRIGLMNTKVELLNAIHSYNIAMLDFEYSRGLGTMKVS